MTRSTEQMLRMACYCIIAALVAALVVTEDALPSDLLSLDHVSLEYRVYQDGSRDPMLIESGPKSAFEVDVGARILTYGFWDVRLEGMSDASQFRKGGLSTKFGLHLIEDKLDVYGFHDSRHCFECTYPYMRFPSDEGAAVLLKLYINPEKQRGLF